MILLADSEGPDQTARAQYDLGLRCPVYPEGTFSDGVAQMIMKNCILRAEAEQLNYLTLERK